MEARRAAVEEALGEPVGKLYVERYFKPEAKARMDALIRNLLAAFKVGIDELEWMSPKRRREAQAKLAKYRLKIALSRPVARLLGARGAGRATSSATSCARAACSTPSMGAPRQAGRTLALGHHAADGQRAATARPTTRSRSRPAILQPPFFDLDADDAINYGAIGAVIGHEISHGFDDQGRKSDGDGNLRDWWTAEDAKKFEERATQSSARSSSRSRRCRG